MPKPTTSFRVVLAILVLCGASLLAAGAQEEPASEESAQPPLTIESLTVTPETPGVGTLVQLRVGIANRGDQIASQLAFRVEINGDPLRVYGNQIFMQALRPGETSEVRLYNFWTTETFRPLAKDRKLRLEVVLEEAHWYRIADVEEEGETIEEWTPLEPVPGLPSSRSLVLDLAKGKPGPYADLELEAPAAPAEGAEPAETKETEPDPEASAADPEADPAGA